MQTESERPAIRKGASVVILNQRMSGEFIVEGRAKLLRSLGDGLWLVRFERDTGTYERFVDEAAQADPAAYVARLNAQVTA